MEDFSWFFTICYIRVQLVMLQGWYSEASPRHIMAAIKESMLLLRQVRVRCCMPVSHVTLHVLHADQSAQRTKIGITLNSIIINNNISTHWFYYSISSSFIQNNFEEMSARPIWENFYYFYCGLKYKQKAPQCNAKPRFSTNKHFTPKQWPIFQRPW